MCSSDLQEDLHGSSLPRCLGPGRRPALPSAVASRWSTAPRPGARAVGSKHPHRGRGARRTGPIWKDRVVSTHTPTSQRASFSSSRLDAFFHITERGCFKTLVLEGSDKNHYVCVIPIDKHLDLKKASKFLKLKSIRMILQKDLEPLTGYVHGGCSPVGMKTSLDRKSVV